jgi:heme-degrading monooxygenase HmoA
MITVANRIYVRQEYADAFEQRFRERAGLVDKMPGSSPIMCYVPSTTVIRTSFFTFWNSRQDFLNWCDRMNLLRATRSRAPYQRMHSHSRTYWRCMR